MLAVCAPNASAFAPAMYHSRSRRARTSTSTWHSSRCQSLLEPVRVIGGANCSRRDDSEAAAALLQQARAGLLTTIVAREANPATLITALYERHLDGSGNRVLSQSVRRDSVSQSTVSFHASRTGTDFVRDGFRTDESVGAVYNGTDAEVLLDDGFAAGYCFQIAKPDRARPDQIGLGFAAADRKRGRIDIDGVLWIDTVARALRDIEYRYISVGRSVAIQQMGRADVIP